MTNLLLGVREKIRKDFLPVLAERKITNQQWRILRVLYETGPLGITHLAAECVLMQPSVAKMVPRLEAMGLVRRKAVSDDRRRRDVEITERGRELVETIFPELDRVYEGIERKLGHKTLDNLAGLLSQVHAKL